MKPTPHSAGLPRRDFLKTSCLVALSTAVSPAAAAADDAKASGASGAPGVPFAVKPFASAPGETLDLSPAKWLWYPGDRTLPNTFVLFRRVLKLFARPRKATSWIIGESRYQLEVNGTRIQWGPAPNDPRWPEVDPMDLTESLTSGENVLGATVLYFGQGAPERRRRTRGASRRAARVETARQRPLRPPRRSDREPRTEE